MTNVIPFHNSTLFFISIASERARASPRPPWLRHFVKEKIRPVRNRDTSKYKSTHSDSDSLQIILSNFYVSTFLHQHWLPSRNESPSRFRPARARRWWPQFPRVSASDREKSFGNTIRYGTHTHVPFRGSSRSSSAFSSRLSWHWGISPEVWWWSPENQRVCVTHIARVIAKTRSRSWRERIIVVSGWRQSERAARGW